MRMVQVENGVIVQYSLPKVGKLKDGTSISGYDLYMISNPDIAKAGGWLPLIDEQPEYNPETHYLMHDGYEIMEHKVVRKYKIEEHPVYEEVPPQPSELEILGQEITTLKLSNIAKDNTINTLGQELTNIKLQLLQGGM